MSGNPNIVFILADNLGWGDLRCYGGVTRTPRIDALAAEGTRLLNYNVENQCTPTRSAILTGRMPVRSGTQRVPLTNREQAGLSPWEYTLGSLFSELGYATAHFGKWHLGMSEARLPTGQGFDEWWGIKETSDTAGYTSNPQWDPSLGVEVPHVWQGKKGNPSEKAEEFNLAFRPYMDEKIAERTVDFIKRNANEGRPFFIYTCFTQIHPPMIVHPDFHNKSGAGTYSDVLMELDYRTGQILDAVDEAGVAKDTIVIFSSDNGAVLSPAVAGGSNGPWRGKLADCYEGSLRAPAILRWPGRVTAGKVTNQMTAALDWLPTLANLSHAGDKVPTDRPIDGVNLAPFFLGEQQQSGRELIIGYVNDDVWAVKWRNIKVHFRIPDESDPNLYYGATLELGRVPAVYDLKNDPGERFNLMAHAMDNLWIIEVVSNRLGEVLASMGRYPNINPGEEFNGYGK